MTQSPLVSVCINCYNAAATIEATLRSVLAQTYTNLQVIVVDDCSTDGTWEIVQQCRDDRLECYRLEENGHISNANNETFRYARGTYIAHLDADDTWFPDKLEKQVAFLEEHPQYGACFATAVMVDEQGALVNDRRFRAENRTREELLYHFLTAGNYLCYSSMLARREVIEQVGEHDRTLLYFHDFDYWIRMAMCCEIFILPENLVTYRLSTGSNSAMTAEKQQAHVNEFARIAYHAVVNCPDALFLKAFASRLRLKNVTHTHEQTALEKAFLLSELIVYLPHNPALGLRRLCELLSDKTYLQIARRDFGFTVKDLYKLSENAVYYDTAFVSQLNNRMQTLTAENDAFRQHIGNIEADRERIRQHAENLEVDRERVRQHARDVEADRERIRQHAENLEVDRERVRQHARDVEADRERIRRHAEDIEADRERIRQHAEDIEADRERIRQHADRLEQQLEMMTNSFSWKLTKPLRFIKRLFGKS